jgi:hypothetical protein
MTLFKRIFDLRMIIQLLKAIEMRRTLKRQILLMIHMTQCIEMDLDQIAIQCNRETYVDIYSSRHLGNYTFRNISIVALLMS